MLSLANKMLENTFMQKLSISFFEIGDDFLKAKMIVDSSMYQPFGLIHGGVLISLAESVASMSSYLFLKRNNLDKQTSTIQVASNHIRPTKSSPLIAKAINTHLGKTIHIFDVSIRDDNNKLINTSKITNIVS